ncbi:hypothetical protein DFJ73DRAFT_767103 [Zopfochytrium polystomum]|nr:hypothetical protein DFJ73DRAFT_767103 [Zopfochytrium polystomum]
MLLFELLNVDGILVEIAVACNTPTALCLAATCRTIRRRVCLDRHLWKRKIARLGQALAFPTGGLHCLRPSAPVHELIDYALRHDPALACPRSFPIASTVHHRERFSRIPELTSVPPPEELLLLASTFSAQSTSGTWTPSRRILHIDPIQKLAGRTCTPCHFKSRAGLIVPAADLRSVAPYMGFVFFDVLSGRSFPLSPDLAGTELFQMPGTNLVFGDVSQRSNLGGHLLVYRWDDAEEDLTLDKRLTASFNKVLAGGFGAAFQQCPLGAMEPWADRRYISVYLRRDWPSTRVDRVLLRLEDDESSFTVSASGDLTIQKPGHCIQSAGWETAVEFHTYLPLVYGKIPRPTYYLEGGLVHFPFAETRCRLEGSDRPTGYSTKIFANHSWVVLFDGPTLGSMKMYKIQPAGLFKHSEPIRPSACNLSFGQPLSMYLPSRMDMDDTRLFGWCETSEWPTYPPSNRKARTLAGLPTAWNFATIDFVTGSVTHEIIEDIEERDLCVVFVEDAWTDAESGITVKKVRSCVMREDSREGEEHSGAGGTAGWGEGTVAMIIRLGLAPLARLFLRSNPNASRHISADSCASKIATSIVTPFQEQSGVEEEERPSEREEEGDEEEYEADVIDGLWEEADDL